ncbi:MAG: DNA repair protein RecO [Oscillospiraceae bacterium]|nr:DNA repair protein RecO [Oscillospiraceae bacterium]
MATHLTVKGLIIRETAVHDADKLCDLLTDNGVVTFQARSVRKQGSKYAAVTQLFSYGEFCLRINGERYYLDSAVSLNPFFGIRSDLDALALASYISELVRKTAIDQSQPQILRLCLHAFHHLSQHDRPAELVKAVFELRFITELGMMPNLVCCPVCLQYQIPNPILRTEEADVICDSCRIAPMPKDIAVTPSVLQAARHVVFSDMEKLFQFRIKGKSAALFYIYTEKYLTNKLSFAPSSLLFFNALGTEREAHE